MAEKERLFCPECPRVVEYIPENDNYVCGGCERVYMRNELKEVDRYGMSADEAWLRHMSNRFEDIDNDEQNNRQ